jgi:hypothetical protein
MIGALIGLSLPVPIRIVGVVMGFRVQVLISAVAFELTGAAYDRAGPVPAVRGLSAGALTFLRRRLGDRQEGRHACRSQRVPAQGRAPRTAGRGGAGSSRRRDVTGSRDHRAAGPAARRAPATRRDQAARAQVPDRTRTRGAHTHGTWPLQRRDRQRPLSQRDHGQVPRHHVFSKLALRDRVEGTGAVECGCGEDCWCKRPVLGMPRFDGQGWWRAQAIFRCSCFGPASYSLGVR